MADSNETAVITLPAVLGKASVLRDHLESLLSGLPFQQMTQQKILIAVDEIFTNIASYAYPDHPGELSVHVAVDNREKALSLRFTDKGIPFDPLKQNDPDVSKPVEDRVPGGLGILVVKRMMDAVEYRRQDNCNILTVTKRFDGE